MHYPDDRGYLRSKSRSRSPVGRGRLPVQRRPPPNRQLSPGPRQRQPYSPGPAEKASSRDSSDSGSSSSSGGSQDVNHKAHNTHGPPRRDVNYGKPKDKDPYARISSLQDELQRERAAKETLQAKTEFLSGKVKAVAERSRNRGSMLVKLIASLRRVDDAKSKLKEAEEELDGVIALATAMMQEEEQGLKKDKEQGNEAEARPKADVERPFDAQGAAGREDRHLHNEPAASDTKEQGGWTEASYGEGDGAGGRFKPFTFKIKL